MIEEEAAGMMFVSLNAPLLINNRLVLQRRYHPIIISYLMLRMLGQQRRTWSLSLQRHG